MAAPQNRQNEKPDAEAYQAARTVMVGWPVSGGHSVPPICTLPARSSRVRPSVDINTRYVPENPFDSQSYFLREYKLTPIVFAAPLLLRDLPLPRPIRPLE